VSDSDEDQQAARDRAYDRSVNFDPCFRNSLDQPPHATSESSIGIRVVIVIIIVVVVPIVVVLIIVVEVTVEVVIQIGPSSSPSSSSSHSSGFFFHPASAAPNPSSPS
jgi:hypothetical protein